MQRNLAPGLGSGEEAPLLVRLGGKLVLEVMPAALASAIGAFLFAQYQFDRGVSAAQAMPPAVAVPASAEMLQLVREEHAMIRDFLTAQQTAQQNRDAAADAANAQGADVEATADATPPAAVSPSAARLPVPRGRATIVAQTGTPESAAAALPPITTTGTRRAAATPLAVADARSDATALVAAPAGAGAAAQPNGGVWPAAPPPARTSIVAETLAVPGHVVAVTLHAVMAVGGIPSWFGHRFGDDDFGAVALPSSSAS